LLLELTYKVHSGSTVKKIPAVIKGDGKLIVKQGTAEIIDLLRGEWSESDTGYNSRLDIIKQATGMQKPHSKKIPFQFV